MTKEKINIAKLLKNCPRGMELDCVMFENVEFHCVTNNEKYPIEINIKDDIGGDAIIRLTKEGYYSTFYNSKCIIFPKGKDSWDGFVPPVVFKDGDIVAYDNGSSPSTVFIYKNDNPDLNTCYFVALSGFTGKFYKEVSGALNGHNPNVRFATEEEKQRLFKAIEDNGYKWNAETNTLERLIKPKFKVGDLVRCISDDKKYIIIGLTATYYMVEREGSANHFPVDISEDKNWELISAKFDINTFKQFDKVLVRDSDKGDWHCDLFSHYRGFDIYYSFCCVGSNYKQCIPYEGNEYLLGTTDDCDDFYKTWED
jgi:hypothetical protein